MNLVFFSHPAFLGSYSMPRFAKMLSEGMRERGHKAVVWTPQPRLFYFPVPARMKKWMGYVDQYLLFPAQVHYLIKSCPADTLFVVTDQGLGIWVPLIKHRPHVVHCHDFLAQRSALGQIPENPTGWSGRRYQAMIRQGYCQAQQFISVSEKTQSDLHDFLPVQPQRSDVVYNGLNPAFTPCAPAAARSALEQRTRLALSQGYVLHVGGNQWYKNRIGVIEIYNAWRAAGGDPLPLLLIGQPASAQLLAVYESSPFKQDIYLLSHLEDEYVRYAYAGASVFLFPSLAEGFGWPIAEAMASGCPVITTAEAPMSTVGGSAATYIARRPCNPSEVAGWAVQAAASLAEVLAYSPQKRRAVVDAGLDNARRFDARQSLDRIERIYSDILQSSRLA